jgi:lantibiotic leader peptide-processing serine protease
MHTSAQQRGTTVSVPSIFNLPTPALRVPVARAITRRLLHRTVVLAIFLARVAGAQVSGSQIDTTSIAPHRYLVLYRNATIPGDAASRVAAAGAHLVHRNEHFGIAAVESQSTAQNPAQDDADTLRRLAAQPNVEYVFHDRIVSAHRLRLQRIAPASSVETAVQSPNPSTRIGRLPTHGPILNTPPSLPAPPPPPPYDSYFTTPQGWAVQQVGGYGNNVPGGPAHGPWDTTMGKGVRIAIIDSGVDPTHPDIAPNLALNMTEVDQSAYPSACDDGTPQDQQGHGTWTASLAAGAIGPGTGQVIGVAPQATILNIKVLQRIPANIAGASTLASQCEAGEASGLLSWVMQGIEDAIANRADVISLSIGATADLTTGDGAGLLAAFNRITYAATQADIVLVASAGNDGLDLSNPRYVELPAQSRGVLALVASTNPACAQNTTPGATCAPGPVTLP